MTIRRLIDVRLAARRRGPSRRWSAVVARSVGIAAVSALAVLGSARADGGDIYRAIDAGDCAAAGDAINAGMQRDEAQAFFLAGYLYDATGCVADDPARAARYYRRAVDLGFDEAADFLGRLYGLGRGVSQDYATAYHWYTTGKKSVAHAADDPRHAAIAGYAMTVAQLARSEARYPKAAERASIESALDVILDPSTGQVSVRNVRTRTELGSNVARSAPFVDAVSAAYADAVVRAPRPPGVVQTPLRFVTSWTFAMRHGKQDETLQGQGAVAIGDTTLSTP